MFLKRINYFIAKVKRAWLDRTLWQKASRFLFTSVRIPFEVTIGYVRLGKSDRSLALSTGFADHRQEKRHHRCDPDHLRRIIAAYKASKEVQLQAAPPFQIRGLWAEWIDVNYQELISALQSENISALSTLLENFNREQFTIGTGGAGYDNYVMYRTSPIGHLYIRTVWSAYRNKLLSLGFDPQNIRFPLVGNPAGIYLNGDVVQINTFRHTYHAVEMWELLRDVPGATVVEIGGGVGGQAYQTVRLAGEVISKYLVFDIPEVATICSYFLLSALPDKRIRLFGEGAVSVDPLEAYDLAVFPHFAIAQLADQSVDLFHNSCSFSEMDSACAAEYLMTIERTCRRYLSHINHEVRFKIHTSDGSTSVNIIGSEMIPNSVLFKRVFKKPRVFCLPEDRPFPAFEYLYERMRE